MAARFFWLHAVPRRERLCHLGNWTLPQLSTAFFSWWIAWLNMIGSILFMISALASYVLPSTGELINSRYSIIGTLLGALCFLLGAILMFPAWGQAVRAKEPARPDPRQHTTS